LRKAMKLAALLALLSAMAWVAAPQSIWSAPDPNAVRVFEQQGLQHSHVMEVMRYLSDVYGPRLTNSPNIREAGEYVVKTLDSWGLDNVREESWGPFGRGWSNELFEANEIAPRPFPLIAFPKAWTPGLPKRCTQKLKVKRIFERITENSKACSY